MLMSAGLIGVLSLESGGSWFEALTNMMQDDTLDVELGSFVLMNNFKRPRGERTFINSVNVQEGLKGA